MGKKNYLQEISVSLKISLFGICIFLFLSGVGVLATALIIPSFINGTSISIILFSIGLVWWFELVYDIMSKMSYVFWMLTKSIGTGVDVTELERDEWNWNIFIILLTFDLVGVFFYIVLLSTGPSNLIPENKIMIVLSSLHSDIVTLGLSLYWELLTSSILIILIGGTLGIYYSLRHRFCPADVCSSCESKVEKTFAYCPHCGHELSPMYSKRGKIKLRCNIGDPQPKNRKKEE